MAVTSALWRHVTRTSLKEPLATSPSNPQGQAPGSQEEEYSVSSPETSQAEGGIDYCVQVCRRQRVSVAGSGDLACKVAALQGAGSPLSKTVPWGFLPQRNGRLNYITF